MSGETNLAERARWNNALYAEVWPKREQVTRSVTPYLMDAVAATPGERVMDIGCGLGPTTLELARRVGPVGRVVGADISEPLLALARRRAAAAGDAATARTASLPVTFVLADVQTDQLDGAPFDAAVSQFGIMFFDDAVAAFRNVHAQLTPAGRLAFSCWRTQQENPWFPGVALAGIAPAPPQPPPGVVPPGPFAFADPERVGEVLTAAGFADVTVTPHDLSAEVSDDAVLDDGQLALSQVPAERMPEAREARQQHLDRFRVRTGVCRIPLAFQIVTARAQSDGGHLLIR